MKTQQHFHFIGICGVAMSALALAFKRQGYTVTGSDAGFYPPVSTHLKDAGIDFYPGWHPEKMGTPDLVIVGNVAGSSNPEWLAVQEKNLPYKSYPEVVRDFFIKRKKHSIVCAGTYGKSTSTALLTWILKEAGYDPSYMFGGLALNDIPAAELTKSDWTVIEGDEYKASRWDTGPKFAYYAPTELLLTSIVWDHADIYPTEKLYQEAFQKLVDSLPKSGLLVISEKATPIITTKKAKQLKLATYGKKNENDYYYSNIIENKKGLQFTINHQATSYKLQATTLGTYMADNITGCFALAKEIGIDTEKIISAVANFAGMKRRLEKRHEDKITIFDDIAHSPSKAEAVLVSLRKIYSGKIIAVFEPNPGNRQPQSAPGYANAFAAADEVIIPRLTLVKKDTTADKKIFEGDQLTKVIGKTHPHVTYIDDDQKLITYLKEKTPKGGVVVFLGSHGFRGMIDELVSVLSRVSNKQRKSTKT
jgi:UDP-N-acetylmuramate: L-alanyl-gamma-D-glutamyl-meso-diaminopimelate ligase